MHFSIGWVAGGTIDVKLQAGIIGHKLNVLNLFTNAFEKKLFATYDERSKAEEEYNHYLESEKIADSEKQEQEKNPE